MQIKIDHIAKIEGHAGFIAEIADGRVVKARLSILEGTRLLEGILRGRSCDEVSQITARICGVCPVVHTLTSLKTLEAAMAVPCSKQTILLRRLMMDGQILNSHSLHLFFFSLSDFFGEKDDLKLIKKYPGRAKDALLIREFGNKIIETIGGRSIHPLTPQIGGFKKLPDIKKLNDLRKLAAPALAGAQRLARFFSGLKYPDFSRVCQFVSLGLEGEYPLYDGILKVNGKEAKPVSEFMPQISENQVQYDGVKRSRFHEKPYMVGALARLNFNAANLKPAAKKVFSDTDLILPSFNPFHNILAQAIEMVHYAEEAGEIMDGLVKEGIEDDSESFEVKAGNGYGAMEAPRGTLFYYYETSKKGLIENANIITPTSQNLARLEEDLKEYLTKISGKSEKEIKEAIKMLVRAYDPCLTCATH